MRRRGRVHAFRLPLSHSGPRASSRERAAPDTAASTHPRCWQVGRARQERRSPRHTAPRVETFAQLGLAQPEPRQRGAQLCSLCSLCSPSDLCSLCSLCNFCGLCGCCGLVAAAPRLSGGGDEAGGDAAAAEPAEPGDLARLVNLMNPAHLAAVADLADLTNHAKLAAAAALAAAADLADLDHLARRRRWGGAVLAPLPVQQ